MKIYWYEMKLRPPGPGCQPTGLVARKYGFSDHAIIGYHRKLTDAEIDEYELAEWEESK